MKNSNWSKRDSMKQMEKMERSNLSAKIFFIGVTFVGGVVYGWPFLMGIIG